MMTLAEVNREWTYILAHLEPAWLVMPYALFVLPSAGIIVTLQVLPNNEFKAVFLYTYRPN